MVAAVGRRREREKWDLDLSVCLAPRGEPEATHVVLPPSLPLGSTFLLHVLGRTSVNQSLPPPPFHHFGSPSLSEGRIAAAGSAASSVSLVGSGTLDVTLGGAEHSKQSRGEEEEEKEK